MDDDEYNEFVNVYGEGREMQVLPIKTAKKMYTDPDYYYNRNRSFNGGASTSTNAAASTKSIRQSADVVTFPYGWTYKDFGNW